MTNQVMSVANQLEEERLSFFTGIARTRQPLLELEDRIAKMQWPQSLGNIEADKKVLAKKLNGFVTDEFKC